MQVVEVAGLVEAAAHERLLEAARVRCPHQHVRLERHLIGDLQGTRRGTDSVRGDLCQRGIKYSLPGNPVPVVFNVG